MLLGTGSSRLRAADQQTNPEGAPPPPVNETVKTVRSLRTIHGNFLDKPLPESALQTILQSSIRAANASNMQSYSVVSSRLIGAATAVGAQVPLSKKWCHARIIAIATDLCYLGSVAT